MKNDILLIRYRKKLSVYFALFVLFSVWLTQGIFTLSNYVTNNLRLINRTETRIESVKNILQNKQIYFSKLKGDDDTLRLVIEKTLQGVTLYENGKKILGTIDKDSFSGVTEKVIYSQNSIFYISNFLLGNDHYDIIIEASNEYSYARLFSEMLWFLLFSLPFTILFFFLGYFFTGKNLKPIQETISSLEDFSSNINHEIKTPLTEIVSTLGLAKRTKTQYDEAIDQSLKSAGKITKILDSMQGLIQLIDVSYKKERTNLTENLMMIIDEYEGLAKKKNITICTDFSQEPFFLKVNRAHLEICIGNLLKNAIKYSYEESKIDVVFGGGILKIVDYGIGISSENIPHIFDRYFRENYTKEDGYGLGLALVKKITDTNRWNIAIESQKNKGTIVTLCFIDN